ATARSERPIKRWISSVRPLCLPRAASRAERVLVARGSIPYSAVIHPSAVFIRCGGCFSSTEQVTNTLVLPNSTCAEPSACSDTPGTMATGRRSSGPRPKDRILPLYQSRSDLGAALRRAAAGERRPTQRLARLLEEALHSIGDRLGEARLVLGLLEPPAFAGMRDETHLDEHGRSFHAGQDEERRLVNASVGGAADGDQLLLDRIGEPGGVDVRFGPRQVGKDEGESIGRLGDTCARRGLRILARGGSSRFFAGSFGREKKRLHAVDPLALPLGGHRVRVDRNE